MSTATANTTKRGRPTVADKRILRGVRANDAEWAETRGKAHARGMGIAAYLRWLVSEDKP